MLTRALLLLSSIKRTEKILSSQIRYKSKKIHWSKLERNKFSKDRALDHFDDFYKKVFGKNWPSIRLALLSTQKYVSIVNSFGDMETTLLKLQNCGAMNIKDLINLEEKRIQHKLLERKITAEVLDDAEQSQINTVAASVSASTESLIAEAAKGSRLVDSSFGLNAPALLEFIPASKLKGMEDFVPESQHYAYYKNEEFPVKISKEVNINFPENLTVFTFEKGNMSKFPPPETGSTKVLDYYLLDGSSLMAVLLMDLRPGNTVLDMCAAPGGKSLAMLQTHYPDLLICGDVQSSRVKRLESVMKQYILDNEMDKVNIIEEDGRRISDYNTFDKVLVDVPCTTDRHSVMESDNNLFKSSRIKERLKLPELQAELLSNALKLAKVGGTVVYSTCSLSPIQNDGVVHMALKKIWEESNIDVEVRDVTEALAPFKAIYHLAEDCGLRYGNLILPHMTCNFGPAYFCKLVRIR